MTCRLATAACILLLLAPQCLAGRKWRTYENCTLRKNQANDGDSFHVKYKNRHYIYRLYFVDTPESDDQVPERLTEQAEYWGITEKEVLQLGKKAAKFTENFLSRGFTVHTRARNARGASKRKRYYAMVQVGDEYLSEALVRQGLARIYGVKDDLADGTKAKTFLWRLKSAERKAKEEKLGGWGRQLTRAEQLRQRMSVPVTPAAPPASPGPRDMPEVVEHTKTLLRSVPVYSLIEADRQVGTLQAGSKVTVLGLESPTMVRVRFSSSPGKIYEAQCHRADLGL